MDKSIPSAEEQLRIYENAVVNILDEEIEKCFEDNKLIQRKHNRFLYLQKIRMKILNIDHVFLMDKDKLKRQSEENRNKTYKSNMMSRPDLTREITKLFDK